MKKNIKVGVIIVGLVSGLALLFSIISLCRSFCHTVSLGFDYMGVIVGVLAIMVTFLVAWNIYSAIDAKEKIKDYQDEIDRLKSLQEEQMKTMIFISKYQKQEISIMMLYQIL